MKQQPLFLQPVFQERIWGGTALRDQFGYDIPSKQTGECWAISGHSNGMSTVKSGPFAGKTIQELWLNASELFGNPKSPVFPLLTKLLDANADLSVQVHPDDDYAVRYENGELGKTECWYVIDCEKDAEIIYGHTAKTKEELKNKISNNQWDLLLKKIKVKPGNFYYVPSGTVHAIGKGIIILEVQQSSDTTYRVYDYDRIDSNGEKRELHLEKAMEVITVPHIENQLKEDIVKNENYIITTFIESEFFIVQKWEVQTEITLFQDKPFMICSVINGKGVLTSSGNKYEVVKGDHFILPFGFGEFTLMGNLEIIMAHI